MTGHGERVAVVGAGVNGLLAAIECALAGHRVTVLDRGPIPNPDSGSADQHRAIRTFAPDDPAATRRMTAATRRWRELETLLGSRFFRPVGAVAAWPADQVDRLLDEGIAVGRPVLPVKPGDLPHVVFPPDTVGVLDIEAGMLLADRALRAAVRWLTTRPEVTLRPGTPVSAVDAGTGRIKLADGTALGADRVLVAAGAWTPELVDLPAVVHRQTMVYLRPPADLGPWWENAPGIGRIGADGRAWLVPPGDGTLLKISSDVVCRSVAAVAAPEDDPDHWTERLLAASILSEVDRYTVVAAKRCHYLAGMGGDGALLRRVGPAVWARTACGGTGFTMAPLVARQIVETIVVTTEEETA